MVTIKYYEDPTTGNAVESDYDSVIDFLRTNFSNRDDLLDLRFFDGEVLGSEIDQSDLTFLSISEGVITVTHDSKIPRGPETWIYVAIAAVMAVATVLLIPKVSIPKVGSSDQQSATNSLGSTTNEAKIGQRTDDIFGYVARHMPPLWQVPYRIGVDNQECEVLLVCIGRGKYETYEDRWFDGDTRLIDIPNAQLAKYEPGTYPGHGSPSFHIGSPITQKIGVYRQSNDLNAAELLPPNELDNSLGARWTLTGSGTTGTLTATTIPSGFVFADSFSVGDNIVLEGMVYLEPDSTVSLYDFDGVSHVFDTVLTPVDLGQNKTLVYEVTAVGSNYLTVTIPDNAPAEVLTAWSLMSGYIVPDVYFRLYNTNGVDFLTRDSVADNETWYQTYALGAAIFPCTLATTNKTQLVSVQFDDSVGPFKIPDTANEIILNFVSASGFYKLVSNKETPISANLQILIEELDINGDPTGVGTTYPVTYSSNDSVRKSVFKTVRIENVPYTYRRVSCKRTTNRDKSDKVSNVDTVEWRDFYSFEPVSNLNLGDVTLAHIVIPSNSQSRLIKERKQNMDVKRKITQYLGNGNFGPAESYATDDFAQILIHMSLDPKIGRMSLSNINADGFLALVNQIQTYFGSNQMTRFGWDFDDTNVTYQDSFVQIGNVVGCFPYVQNGVYDLSFERRQETSSMQITCRNKIPDTETREQNFERLYDGVEVSWRDETYGTTETYYIPEDQSAVNPERIELNGCITYEQAYKYAWRVYNKQIHNRFSTTFDVDEFGRNIIPGKRIDSPDGTRFTRRAGAIDGYRVYDGEVIEVRGLTVELSEPIAFTEGEDHYITFTSETGDNSAPILCTRVDDFTVLLSELPDEAIYDGYSKDRTKFVFASEQLLGSVALIPQTIEFKLDDDGNEVNTVASMAYSHKYYQNDFDVIG